MGDDNQILKDDMENADTPKAQDVSKEPQQLTGLSKPTSYGTTLMQNSLKHGSIEEESNE